jgi:hypothetical protein
MSRRLQIVGSGLLWAAFAGLFAPAQSQDAGAPRIVLETLEGARSTRPLEGLSVARLSELPAACVSFEGLAAPTTDALAIDERAELRLLGGDWLSAKVVGGNGDVLDLELSGGQKVSVVVDQLQSLIFPGRLSPAQRGLLQRPEHGDRLLWIRPGGVDRVDGTLEAFGADGPKYKSLLGSRSFPWAEVAALYIEAVGEREPVAADSSGVVVDLADGGRVHAHLKRLDAQKIALDGFAGRALELPLNAVAELCADDGSLAYLSDLAPSRAVEGWPSGDDLGMKWSYQIDRAVTGGSLRAGGRAWRRGIGVHAPSRLEWTLDGTWSVLRGTVAIDDSVLLLASRGSVQFRVFVDDHTEPAWSSGRVQGGETPIEMPALALKGVHKLSLEVDMDDKLYVADRADWLRLRMVRASK